ncbi:acetate kinase [Kwoniella dejecticola CBS 10117]|uniref:Probable acetate kinase n=1 Tax=Kwoniella dejecticola CBS 10117 TaxID=1296121 RepID=A0A1A6A2N3_9TREE|nr:acetate kinase [Kwoniella dejecticola CBS 10117]OBR84309.1 acetate kinase [Kwoniella dejecticola CBS 10117]
MTHLLAINCGSSSIKGKLFGIPKSKSDPLEPQSSLEVVNIGSKDEKVKIKITWEEGKGENLTEEGKNGDEVDYESLIPFLLDHLTSSASNLKKEDIKYVTHRIVHGGAHTKGIIVTKEHEEALEEMDKLSEFAPLHNHHAVVAVRSVLDALPNHTSLMVFDTLFHATIPEEVYTYALPPPDREQVMPLRKYGFHGLSYASIVQSMAQHLGKKEEDVNIVVAHLGSGASACCIKGGQSIDTTMGLTPLEGLIGGTRSGTIDPTAIFHLTANPAEGVDFKDYTVSKAEILLNKKSGLAALAGTTNFGTIISRLDPSNCGKEEHEKAVLAYKVYLDRLMNYISQYLFKLLSQLPIDKIDGVVFSGGIGEKGSKLREDALTKLSWLGAEIDKGKNDGKHAGKVTEITTEGSKLKGWVVETDEEGWSAKLARDEFGF